MYHSVTPNYFHAMGIPLLRGRVFTEQDVRGKPGVIIINETLARRFWPDEDPIGERLAIGLSFDDEGAPESYEIVGIVGDVRHRRLDADVFPQMFLPYRQQTWDFMSFVLRTNGDPLRLVGGVRGQVRAVDKDQPVYGIRTMEQYVSASVAQRRFSMLLLGIFAALAVALAAGGTYGVISYSVSQRTHEIGIRMALGAQRRDIFKLVVGQGMGPVLIGVGIGLAASLALTRFLSSLLFGVSATDPVTFAGVAVLLAAVALLACYIPARRATRVDPLVALRYE